MSLKFFIFHGWGADSSANWFEHTRQFIVEAGAECHVPDFPESESPVYGEWVRHLEEHVEKIDENNYKVTRGLCIPIDICNASSGRRNYIYRNLNTISLTHRHRPLRAK